MSDNREVGQIVQSTATTHFAVRMLVTLLVGWGLVLLCEVAQEAGLVTDLVESILRLVVWTGMVALLLYLAFQARLKRDSMIAMSVFGLCSIMGFAIGVTDDIDSLDNAFLVARGSTSRHLLKKFLFAGWACSIGYIFFTLFRNLDQARERLDIRVQERTAELEEAKLAIERAHDQLEERVRQRTLELSKANRELSMEIDERKQAEESLREGDRRLRLALDATQSSCWDVNLKTGELISTRPSVEWLGYQPQEIEPSREAWKARIHPDDAQIPQKALQEHLEGRKPVYECEYRVRGKLGEWYWTQDKGMVVERDEDGTPLRIVGTDTDVTERKRIDQLLRESEARYRTLVENAPEAIVVEDVDEKRFVDVNQNAVDLFKLDREALLKTGLAQLSRHIQGGGHSSIELLRQYTDRTLAGDCPVFEWLYRDAHGNELPCEVRLIRLPAAGRNLIRGSIIDIRERKQIEEQLHRLREEITFVSRQCTMGELAAGLAHELNQPLASIATYAFTARQVMDECDTEVAMEPAEILELLEEQSVRAGDVVRRMRRFVGPAEPIRAVEDLNALVEDVIHLMDSEVRISQVNVDLRLNSRIPPVTVDGIQIQQVVLNLIRNALDAMEETKSGQRKLTIRTLPNGDGFIKILVQDSGMGLPKKSVDEIFDSFVTTKDDGMGMGLAISRGIIEAHGGRIWAASNRARGATFGFTLPAATGDSSGDGVRGDTNNVKH